MQDVFSAHSTLDQNVTPGVSVRAEGNPIIMTLESARAFARNILDAAERAEARANGPEGDWWRARQEKGDNNSGDQA